MDMCAQFTIEAKLEDIANRYQIQIERADFESTIQKHIRPFQLAPVVIRRSKYHELAMMNFSLIPSWSKEKKPKFATHNARIESAFDKPTWKGPLLHHRAIVPMSTFIEPIYRNQFAGNMVKFFETKYSLLNVAAIWSEWEDKITGELIESFAILTTEPDDFIKNTGHDRQPVFLQNSSVSYWLDSKMQTRDEITDFIKKNQFQPQLDCSIDRPLKPGWEKRIGS